MTQYDRKNDIRPHKKKKPGHRLMSGLRIGGGYLLSHFRSTIGVVRFNFSVRNGKRWSPDAITTLIRFAVGDALSGALRCIR